jgi:nucleoside-triphosphatase THEP1
MTIIEIGDMELLIKKTNTATKSFTKAYNNLTQILHTKGPSEETVKVKFKLTKAC